MIERANRQPTKLLQTAIAVGLTLALIRAYASPPTDEPPSWTPPCRCECPALADPAALQDAGLNRVTQLHATTDNWLFAEPVDWRVPSFDSQQVARVRQIADRLEERGMRLVVLATPPRILAYPTAINRPAPATGNSPHRASPAALTTSVQRSIANLRAEGVAVVDLSPVSTADGHAGVPRFFRREAAWNGYGAAAAARITAHHLGTNVRNSPASSTQVALPGTDQSALAGVRRTRGRLARAAQTLCDFQYLDEWTPIAAPPATATTSAQHNTTRILLLGSAQVAKPEFQFSHQLEAQLAAAGRPATVAAERFTRGPRALEALSREWLQAPEPPEVVLWEWHSDRAQTSKQATSTDNGLSAEALALARAQCTVVRESSRTLDQPDVELLYFGGSRYASIGSQQHWLQLEFSRASSAPFELLLEFTDGTVKRNFARRRLLMNIPMAHYVTGTASRQLMAVAWTGNDADGDARTENDAPQHNSATLRLCLGTMPK